MISNSSVENQQKPRRLSKKETGIITTLEGIQKDLSPHQARVLNKISFLYSISRKRYRGLRVAFSTHAELAKMISADKGDGARLTSESVRRCVERLGEYGLLAVGCMKVAREDASGNSVYGRASVFIPLRTNLDGWTKPPPGKTRSIKAGRDAMRRLRAKAETGHEDVFETGHEDAFLETGHEDAFYKPATRTVCRSDTEEGTLKKETDDVRASAHVPPSAQTQTEALQAELGSADPKKDLENLWKILAEEIGECVPPYRAKDHTNFRRLALCWGDRPCDVLRTVVKHWEDFTSHLVYERGKFKLPTVPDLALLTDQAGPAMTFWQKRIKEEERQARLAAEMKQRDQEHDARAAAVKVTTPKFNLPEGVAKEEFEGHCERVFDEFLPAFRADFPDLDDAAIREKVWPSVEKEVRRMFMGGLVKPAAKAPPHRPAPVEHPDQPDPGRSR